MQSDDKKRSSIFKLDPQRERSIGADQACAGVRIGVGGRSGIASSSSGGGGYLDICSDFKVGIGGKKIAPREKYCLQLLDELREIKRLPAWILQLADEIGVCSTLIVWEKLNSLSRSKNDTRVHIPTWGRFTRLQRNKYIKALAAQGESVKSIQQKIKSQLRESISLTHIKRIIGQTV